MSTYDTVGRLWNGTETKISAFYDYQHNYPLNGDHCVIISTNNASSSNGSVVAAEAWFQIDYFNNTYNYGESKWNDIVVNWKFATFSKSGDVFTQRDIMSSWATTTIDEHVFQSGLFWINPDVSGIYIDIQTGDYIGIVIENNSSGADINVYPVMGGTYVESNSYIYSSDGSSSPYTCDIHNYWEGSIADMQEGLVYGVIEIPDGDLPAPNYTGQNPETCYTYTTDIDVPGWYNYYGYLRFDEILTSPYRATVDVKTPWLAEHHDQTMEEGVTYVFRNPVNRSECYSVTLDSLYKSGSTEIVSELTECYYYATEENERWVSDRWGSDSNAGTYSTQAYKTIGKAITEVGSGGLIHIQEGLYAGVTSVSSISKSLQFSPEDSNWNKGTCEVYITPENTSTIGQTSYDDNISPVGYDTIIDTSSAFTSSGRVVQFKAYIETAYTTGYEPNIIVVRDTGTYYMVVGVVDIEQDSSSDGWRYYLCDIEVQSGDMIGYTCSFSRYYGTTSGTTKLKKGDVHLDTVNELSAKTNFTDHSSFYRLPIVAYVL